MHAPSQACQPEFALEICIVEREMPPTRSLTATLMCWPASTCDTHTCINTDTH